MKSLLLFLLLLPAGCSGSDRSILIARAPSDDLSVRRFYVAVPSNRLITEREPIPNDPAAFVTIDLVEHDGVVRAFHADDPSRGRCSSRWVSDVRASDVFPDHPNGDRKGWFRGVCEGTGKGEVYDLDGSCFGACPGGNLSGFPVSIEGDAVRIHLPEPQRTRPIARPRDSVAIPRSTSVDPVVRLLFVDLTSTRVLPEGEVPSNPTGFLGFYLVEHSGIVHAFQPTAPDRCAVIWKPDLRASSIFPEHPNGDRVGWFWGPCQGEVYDLDGTCFGACLGEHLREYRTSVEKNQIRVHLPKD